MKPLRKSIGRKAWANPVLNGLSAARDLYLNFKTTEFPSQDDTYSESNNQVVCNDGIENSVRIMGETMEIDFHQKGIESTSQEWMREGKTPDAITTEDQPPLSSSTISKRQERITKKNSCKIEYWQLRISSESPGRHKKNFLQENIETASENEEQASHETGTSQGTLSL